MALADRIKTNLGIVHTGLDTEITNQIADAKAELYRLGVPASAVTEASTPVESAIIAYVCYKRTIGAPESAEWFRVWDYESDCLRKTTWENAE